jgi:hypothetical protein
MFSLKNSGPCHRYSGKFPSVGNPVGIQTCPCKLELFPALEKEGPSSHVVFLR